MKTIVFKQIRKEVLTMNFLNNLDYLLKLNRMSRSDLGRAVSISPSTINSWFNRSSDGVALKSLVDIANYFNISLDILVNSADIAKDMTKAEEKRVIEIANPFTDNEVKQIKRLLKYYELFNERLHEKGGDIV